MGLIFFFFLGGGGGGGGGGRTPQLRVWRHGAWRVVIEGALQLRGWGTRGYDSGWGLRIREWMEFGWGFGPIMRVGLWSHEGKSGSKKRKALPHLFPASHTHFDKATPKITGWGTRCKGQV